MKSRDRSCGYWELLFRIIPLRRNRYVAGALLFAMYIDQLMRSVSRLEPPVNLIVVFGTVSAIRQNTFEGCVRIIRFVTA